MLYMVEMDLPDRSRLPDWHDWYNGHIRNLLAADGYDGGQRFEATATTPSPFLAIHDVSGPELFESDGYKSIGGPSGTGEWRTVMTNWHRNLYQGMGTMPAVGKAQQLVICAEGSTLPAPFAERVTWLSAVGLDQSIPSRGLLVLDLGEDSSALAAIEGVLIYRPIAPKIT
jgi:hypothetical protein